MVRDFDGTTRHVERRGRTRNAAQQALKKVRALGQLWFTELSGNGHSPNTIQLYRDRLDRQ